MVEGALHQSACETMQSRACPSHIVALAVLPGAYRTLALTVTVQRTFAGGGKAV